MIYGLYNSAAGMMTNEYRQDVLANNIANAETVGFKRDVPTFAERLPARLAGERHGPGLMDLQSLSGGMWLGKTYTDHSPAAKVQTDNPLDVAIDGRGFLAVGVDGQPHYTRDGRMTMHRDGTLVSVTDGAPVLGRGGGSIRLNPLGGTPQIDTDGRVHQDGRIAGELMLVDFDDYTLLKKVDAQRFVADGVRPFEAAAIVQSGHVESSGVEPLADLVSMIEASRAYQINAKMISMQDESAGRLISQLLRA